MPAADHEPEVRERQVDEAVQELDARVGGAEPEEAGADYFGEQQANRGADQGTKQVRDADGLQAPLEQNTQPRQHETEYDVEGRPNLPNRLERARGKHDAA